MILHLVDDEKIINRTIKSFEESLPGLNHFICFVHSNNNSSVFVEKKDNITFVYGEYLEEYNLEFSIFDKVVFHGLSVEKIEFYQRNIFNKTTNYWALWGADLYNLLLKNRGYKLYSSENSYYNRLKRVKSYIRYIFKIYGKYDKILSFFILNKIDYLLDSCVDEYILLDKYLNVKRKISQLDFFYYPVDEILPSDLLNKYAKGNNILVGNSASFTNNHELAIKILKKISIDQYNYNVVMPLNYGGNKIYIDNIINKGKNAFGNNFLPITKFLPLNDYNKLLSTTSICLFNNWRQEACGNILICLYLGSKVYLSEKNPLYNYYSRLGLIVFSIEKISIENFFIPLNNQEIFNNRSIVKKRYSKKYQDYILKNIFQ